MRRTMITLCLVPALHVGLLVVAVRAQQGVAGRAAPAPTSPYPSSSPTRANGSSGEPDLLSPYASKGARSTPYDSESLRYSRTPAKPRPPVRLDDRVSRGAVFARGVGNYYPAMRPGQAPNRNVVDHRSLCVPGRRAVLQR